MLVNSRVANQNTKDRESMYGGGATEEGRKIRTWHAGLLVQL
jgi:hypothetical protein